ncbi:MAG: OmpA family protein [Gammaproteobacteria bacterium]|nr:OmpA family protein [Gammaproteobacteria bacterium]
MSKQSTLSSTSTRRSTTRRYWRRTDARRPWWPWGLLPLVGLVVLFLFGALVTAPHIQAEVRTQVADRYSGAGVMATDVRSDGQGISVQAVAQTRDEIYLHALAKATQCDTWAGKLTCPTTVTVSLSEPAKPPVVPAREQLAAPTSASSAEKVDVLALSDQQRCDAGFDEILSSANIRFRTGSANIDRGNEDLLRQLAELARSCPGNLVVAGHTDSRGDASTNRALSLARAAAVRDALIQLGIDTDRVTAKGYGESMPIADNETPNGRATNRRIVITTEPSN